MSFVQSLAAAATRVVVLPAPNGGSLYVRIKRPTAGQAIASGVTALVQPPMSEEDKAIAETVGKRRAALRSKEATADLHKAMHAAQARIVAMCVTHIGPTEATMEPVTILVSESDVPRPGTEGLQINALTAEWLLGIATAIWDSESPGGWTALTASAFPGGGAGGNGGDGAGVGSAA